jgi:hypothetical protein
MDTPRTRILHPSRIVALMLIALAMLGLAYLRYGPDDNAVSVPPAANASDLSPASEEYATESGSSVADGETPIMPTHRAHLQWRLITLPVGRWLKLAFLLLLSWIGSTM